MTVLVVTVLDIYSLIFVFKFPFHADQGLVSP